MKSVLKILAVFFFATSVWAEPTAVKGTDNFKWIYKNVFQAHCLTCHFHAAEFKDYNSIVKTGWLRDRDSEHDGTPYDPTNAALYQVITVAPGAAHPQMPPQPNDPVNEPGVNAVFSWLKAGHANN